MKERLDKWISTRSAYSRKDVKDLLRRGKVRLNGGTVLDPSTPVTDADFLEIDGNPFTAPAHLYLMLHKPKGVVSAVTDKNEKTVIDLVPAEWKRNGLFPAGRLDKSTTGFLILTDDGDFAHRILSPAKHVDKTYRVTLLDPVQPHYAAAFTDGIVLGDGTRCLSATLQETDDPCTVRVILHEGRYHQVKRMFASLGNCVTALHRESIGSLSLDPALNPGECRPITPDELRQITE